jgi:formiminotetrahydrofolate cyclodeaminase
MKTTYKYTNAGLTIIEAFLKAATEIKNKFDKCEENKNKMIYQVLIDCYKIPQKLSKELEVPSKDIDNKINYLDKN